MSRTRTRKAVEADVVVDAPVDTPEVVEAEVDEVVDTPEVADEPVEPEATPEPKAQPEDRYAPESESIKDRLSKIDTTWTRPAIIEATEINGTHSAVWRAQHGRVHPHEVDLWMYFLTQVEEGKIRPPAKVAARSNSTRVSRDDLLRRNERAIALIEAGDTEAALFALRGEAPVVVEPEPTE